MSLRKCLSAVDISNLGIVTKSDSSETQADLMTKFSIDHKREEMEREKKELLRDGVGDDMERHG